MPTTTSNLQVTISISEAGGQLTPPSVVLSAQPNGVLQTQTTWSLNPGPVLATSSFLPPQPHFTNTPTNQTWASSWNPQTGAYMSNQHFPQVPWMTTGMTASSWPSVHSMPQPASTCTRFSNLIHVTTTGILCPSTGIATSFPAISDATPASSS